MSATNIFETELLSLIFNNVPIPGISSSPSANLYISLHTADPGEAGNQSTNEAQYLSYARVSITRDTNGFKVVEDLATNVEEVVFPSATGGSDVVTHFGIGLNDSGAGKLLLRAPLTAELAISNGITPVFQVGELKSFVS